MKRCGKPKTSICEREISTHQGVLRTSTNTQKADAGFVKGRQREIACQCWFTSKGKVTPLMLKVQDEDGEIRTVHQIQVLSQEEKMYAGMRSIEFDCIITILEQQINV